MAKQAKTPDVQIAVEVEEIGDTNDIRCIDCERQYALVPGASNCRCKSCNTLYKHNHPKQFGKRASKAQLK